MSDERNRREQGEHDERHPRDPGREHDGNEERQPPKGPRVDPEDAVEEASYESFPASDPPSFNPGKASEPTG